MARKKFDAEAIRKRMQEKQGGRGKDPTEFRIAKVQEGEKKIYRFFILPPLAKGDTTADGEATGDMDMFYLENGSHWINNKAYACPRAHGDKEECPVCQLGFDLMNETDDRKRRSQIAKNYLSSVRYGVNIYFTKDKANPEELRGKVMWYNGTKSIYDLWEACVMNEDEGDESDPQACGVFFDPYEGYVFQVEVTEKGGWNNYEKSKFLASNGKRPVVMDKDGKPIDSKIEEVLAQRHDLFSKFQPRDIDVLKELKKSLLDGDSDDEDGGFDEDEANEVKSESKKDKPKPKPKAKDEEPEEAEESEEAEEVEESVEAEAEAEVEEAEETEESEEKPKPKSKPKADKEEAAEVEDEDEELQALMAELDEDTN